MTPQPLKKRTKLLEIGEYLHLVASDEANLDSALRIILSTDVQSADFQRGLSDPIELALAATVGVHH